MFFFPSNIQNHKFQDYREAWKMGQPPMHEATPRYKKEAAKEDLPKTSTPPTLKLCQIVENKLIIPKDIRAQYISCPIFSPEWRELLTAFDKSWSHPVGEKVATESPIKKDTSCHSPNPSNQSVSDTTEVKKEEPAFDWSAVFPAETESVEELKKKFGDQLTELAGSSGLTFCMVPGPMLFLTAPKDPVHLGYDQPLITHGAGAWVLGEKAKKFVQHNPGKGFPCSWTSDDVPVVLEERSLNSSYPILPDLPKDLQ